MVKNENLLFWFVGSGNDHKTPGTSINTIFFQRGIPVRSMFTKISFQCSVASSETVYCCSISIYLVYMLLVCRHHSVVMCSWSPPDIQLTKQYTIRENHFPTLWGAYESINQLSVRSVKGLCIHYRAFLLDIFPHTKLTRVENLEFFPKIPWVYLEIP